MGFLQQAFAAFEAFLYGINLHELSGPLLALPLPLVTGILFWLVRRAVQKKRLGEGFAAERRRCRLNEIIRALFVIWAVETAMLTIVPELIEIYVITFLRSGKISTASLPMFDFAPQYILSMAAHFFTSFRLSEFFSLHSVLNTLFFMPFGLALPFIWKKANLWRTSLLGFIISLAIELIQPFVLRVGELADLICNTLGALIGYLLFMLIKRLFPRFTEKCMNSVGDNIEAAAKLPEKDSI